MRFWIRMTLPVVAAVSLAATGCGKVKDALEEAAGIKQLDQSEVDTILKEVGWDVTKNPQLANFEVVKGGGFELTDKFKGDLSKETKLGPIPLDVPDQGKTAAGNQRSYMLVRQETITIDAATSYKRLRIATVAAYDPGAKELQIDGTKVNEFIDKKNQISRDGGQAGKYLLIQAKGDKGLAYLTGLITIKKADATTANVEGATVFTTTSPFVTVTGSEGKYLLAMLEGGKGTVLAFHGGIVSKFSAPGTPTSASKEIAYAGALDKYKEGVLDKAGKVDTTDAVAKTDSAFDKVNGKVTDFINGWTLITSDLMFVQPKQEASPPAKAPVNNPAPDPAPAPAPTVEKPADPVIPADSVIVRRDDETAKTQNVDLGCSGISNDNALLDFVRNGAEMDDTANHPGWRSTGDVQYSWDLADVMFKVPDASTRYVDQVNGYCLLSTGNALYKLTNDTDAAYLPGPDGAGQTSEMWQSIHVPKEAKSIQVRVAFFSQEFPTYVGTQFNDSFFIKFDESPDVIAAGSLNDLAGINSTDAAVKTAVEGCSNITSYDASKTCGDWGFTNATAGMHGELGFIQSSTTAVPQAATFGCRAPGATGDSTKCYHGMIAPRIICKDIADTDKGQNRTLRFNVSDAGDAYFDSALAVDSVVFSQLPCSDPAGRMTDEKDSRASAVGQ